MTSMRSSYPARPESLNSACPPEIVRCTHELVDLAPDIFRQRLVIEGTSSWPIVEDQVRRYLTQLTGVCGMRLLKGPVTHRSEKFGWAGWVHWETSGAHFYAWESPVLFFSVDIYTCKEFDPERAYGFTQEFFRAPRIVAMAF